MKFKILILLLSSIAFKSSAQILHLTVDSATKKFTYLETIKCDSTSSDTLLFNGIKDWAISQSLNFNRLQDDKAEAKGWVTGFVGTKYVSFAPIDLQYKNKNVIKSEQLENKKIILSGVFKYTSKLLSCLQTSYTNFDVIIKTKRGKAQIAFTNFSIDDYDTGTASPTPLNGLSLEKLLKIVVDDYGGVCIDRVKEYTVELQNQCDLILKDFKKFAPTIKPSTKDDW